MAIAMYLNATMTVPDSGAYLQTECNLCCLTTAGEEQSVVIAGLTNVAD